jgi:DNA-binding NarL/FixJ family response regulator
VHDVNSKSDAKKKDVRHWKARLVHRKYTDLADPRTAGHFSARIEQDGTGCYFPLGSDDQTRAAVRAQEIYRCVQAEGWSSACARYSREFTFAVFWNSNPLLCTYTTLLTSPGNGAAARAPRSDEATKALRLVIVEADDVVRGALAHWSRLVSGCVCVGTFASPRQAQAHLSRTRPNLVFFNRSLPEFQLNLATGEPNPRTLPFARFAFGIYETSDDIFISHTGVGHGYFLRRTPPAQVLAPILSAWSEGSPALNRVLRQTRDYFQDLIVGTPGAMPPGEKAELTPREEEILLRLSKGYQDKQIADAFDISAWTVHNHIKNIFKKLGVHSRTQAVIKHLQR